MTYRDTIILLPCHSLEDFPMHSEGANADGLLAAWTVLWHPALLAATGSAPTWHHAGYPPEDLSRRLILVPEVSRDELQHGLVEQARAVGATVLVGNFDRAQLLAEALAPIGSDPADGDAELAADFLALGYCYLQVELLTRQMRYATNLDELQFNQCAVEGAVAWRDGDEDQAHEKLVACFDLLAQERDHYYAVDAYVLDLILLAPTTLGAPLDRLLAVDAPANILATSQVLEHLAAEAPATLARLRARLAEESLGLVGGEQWEGPSTLLSCESLLRSLRAGNRQLERMVKARAHVYGRRRFGMTPLHPQLLSRLGFVGALHATVDGGRFPEGTQAKLRWEGSDLTTIDTVGRVPLNAALPETFLGFAGKLGESMDMDHVATVVLAHWPGRESPWYHDLRRTVRYGGILGKFVTAEQYFRESDYPTQLERFKADQYYAPYLVQAVQTDQTNPISRVVRYWRRRTRLDAARAMLTAASGVTGVLQPDLARLDRLAPQIDAGVDANDHDDQIDHELDDVFQSAAGRLARLIPRTNGPPVTGCVTLNPYSTVRRASADWSELPEPPAIEKPIYAAARDGQRRLGVVDVPPMGFVWVGGTTSPAERPADGRPLAESDCLVNEFMTAHIDPKTGALRALYSYDTRGNRLSQQVAFRIGQPSRRGGPNSGYTIMAADRVQVTANTTAMAEIVTAGRLVMRNGDVAATFRQQFQIWRGSRVLQLGIDIDPHTPPHDRPWDSYYACRFAWPSESAVLWRGLNQQRQRGEAKRLEAPLYIDLDDGKHRTTLFTRGLPFHRRTGPRMLDSLLIVRGEHTRHFELGIGLDVKYPLQESLALLCPLPTVTQALPEPSGSRFGWLFHIDCRNVVATAWEPVVDGEQVAGFRVRLLESMGRPARLKLSAFRPMTAALQRDFSGDSLGDLTLTDGAVQLSMDANQWVEVEARW